MSECKAALAGSHAAVARALEELDAGHTSEAKLILRIEERRLRRLVAMRVVEPKGRGIGSQTETAKVLLPCWDGPVTLLRSIALLHGAFRN